MKKLKTLGTIITAAGILSFTAPAFTTRLPYEVPQYNREDAIKVIEREKPGHVFITQYKVYCLDRNEDKTTDLMEINLHMEIAQGPHQGGYDLRMLFIDDDYDGKLDRRLFDVENEKGELGMDCIYETEDKIQMDVNTLIEGLEK